MNEIAAGKQSARRRPSRATGNIMLADVAKIAGVSAITVSRAMNRPEMVTAATLVHVQEAIARTGYVPNLLAGGLASKHIARADAAWRIYGRTPSGRG